MMQPSLRLDLLRSFLGQRGWRAVRATDKTEAYEPPVHLGLPEDYRLHLPVDAGAVGAVKVLARIRAILSDLYELSEDQLNSILSARDLVVAIQLVSPDYELGSVPLLRFDGIIEKLKKTLLDTAAFVVTEAPTIEFIPDEAHAYLSKCRFLQTEVGSYVAKIQLPAEQPLMPPDLFPEEEVASDEINQRLIHILRHVTNVVLQDPTAAFSIDVFEENLELVNVDVLKDVRDLLERTGADHVNFSFTDVGSHQTVSSGPLSSESLNRLDQYIEFARERFAADLEVDMVGRIVELRSRSPDRRRNYVGITGIFQGREVFITLRMSRKDYPYAVMAHNRNRPVRIVGAAKRMRTQLRITRLDRFEEIEN